MTKTTTVIAVLVAYLTKTVLTQSIADQLSCDFNLPIDSGGLCNYAPGEVPGPMLQDHVPRGDFNNTDWRITERTPRQSNKIDGPLSGVENSGNQE